MYLATDLAGFGCRERLAGTQQQPKGKTKMSAKSLVGCNFEPAPEQSATAGQQAPEGFAAEIQFRADLWREYRREAINAGFSIVQASEYANALSPEMGLAIGVFEVAPVGRGWFYQSRIGAVNRTITSGLITLARRERTRTISVPKFAFGFRPWNGEGKS